LKINEGEKNNPQRNPKENYIGQNCRKEEIDLVAQLNQVPTKEDNKRLYLILEKAKAKMIGMTKQVPIKDDKKKKMLGLEIKSTKEEKTMKGYALSLKRQRANNWHN